MTLADLVRQTLSRTQPAFQGIFAILHKEHQAVSSMIAAIKATEDREDAEGERARMFSELRAALLPHAKAEQEVLYARLQGEEGTRAVTLEAVQEHQLVNRLVNELDNLASAGELWMAKFKVLAENIEHHVKEEERVMFPRARRVLASEEIAELTSAYEEARDRHMVAMAPRIPETGRRSTPRGEA